MRARSFGQALGALVRQKRLAQGLTQAQLAEDAFESSGKTRRISELESGSVANPHPKTIDPIIAQLRITDAEIEECARIASVRSDDDLDRAYREARNLIDAIARQFEHDQPSATLAELDRFLRSKATEWAALRDRIASITADENTLAEIKKNAQHALSEGNLEEVDALLAKAEEQYQYRKTLIEVRQHVSIRVSRGDSSLLKGDANTALKHYTTAVEFYRPFDENAMVHEINEIAYKIYEISRRSLKPIYFVGASLLELLITLPTIKANPSALAEASYQIGLIYRNEYDDLTSPQRDEALTKAIHYSSLAVEAPETQTSAYKMATSSIGLANCLRARAKKTSNIDDFENAIDLLTSIKLRFEQDEEVGPLMPHLCNSLGAILQNLVVISEADKMADVQARAMDAFKEAVFASEKYHNFEVWGAARFNIGAILAARATDNTLEQEERQFLRLRAIIEISAAVETYPSVAFPFRLAEAQALLGEVFYRYAVELQDHDLSEAYLFRAVQSLEVSSEIISQARNPIHWAHLQFNLGAIFDFHAGIAEVAVGLDDLNRALNFFEEALAVFEGKNLASEVIECREAIKRARLTRKALLKIARK